MSSTLWMGIYLPQLALSVAGQYDDSRPVAVTEKSTLFQVNPRAAQAGVRVGMRPSAALAQWPDLQLIARRPQAETEALQRLAAWCYQFSNDVRLWPAGLVLEVGGSLTLYGSLDQLQHQLQQGLADIGHSSQLATSLSARASWLLATHAWQQPLQVLSRLSLWQVLKQFPVRQSGLAPQMTAALESSGIHTLGALLKLSESSLLRRFDSTLLHWLQELVGKRGDGQARYKPPRHFASQIELSAAASDIESLRFPLKRLIGEFCGCLRGLDATGQRLEIRFEHRIDRDAPSASTSGFTLGLASPSQRSERWLAVLWERLERYELPQPVCAIHISAQELEPAVPEHGDLFAGVDRNRDRIALLERLQQRVQVHHLAIADDHRPEHGWCHKSIENQNLKNQSSSRTLTQPKRPLWLLPEPESIARPTLLQGPERIEAGWWDGASCRRDYYHGVAADGRRLWVFREPNQSKWFLHGYFY